MTEEEMCAPFGNAIAQWFCIQGPLAYILLPFVLLGVVLLLSKFFSYFK